MPSAQTSPSIASRIFLPFPRIQPMEVLPDWVLFPSKNCDKRPAKNNKDGSHGTNFHTRVEDGDNQAQSCRQKLPESKISEIICSKFAAMQVAMINPQQKIGKKKHLPTKHYSQIKSPLPTFLISLC
ncbi:unnamed protein product [Cuscuta epithymum]|uniref:Uncharacterized protein n=1 Tax=Cuscuta epithymum TaxID=186058 RepID=A0AAV0EW77_9ASTE|nr:unnamed protein product [Cuscuta epithymum]